TFRMPHHLGCEARHPQVHLLDQIGHGLLDVLLVLAPVRFEPGLSVVPGETSKEVEGFGAEVLHDGTSGFGLQCGISPRSAIECVAGTADLNRGKLGKAGAGTGGRDSEGHGLRYWTRGCRGECLT